MQRKLWPVIGIFAVTLAGCSGSDVIVRKQVEMEGTLDRLTQENAALGLRVTKFGEALKDLQTQVKAAAGDPEVFSQFRVQVDSMQHQLTELNRSVAQLQQAQTQQAAQQLAAPPAAPAAPAAGEAVSAHHDAALAPAVPEAAPVATHAEPKAAAAKAPEGKRPAKEAYDKAFALFNAQNFDGAAAAFEKFAKDEPRHVLAPNAYYWAGECYYSQKRYARALETFNKVVAQYPKASKVPDALLKIGFTQISLNDQVKAKGTLKSLVEKFPKSPAAAKARERLAHL
ncbi:tol-pal system protein YbgF [Geomesophilobacter sediminis]|uniref:Tol-pal system protein YbgF n=1 Tax=Geomesophilobacter sediminis TaxID=2798584 RepID=A0A8J7IN05_9BACT|nr:tol-pal system protein YbgF [Geomesophilobacter sediminis]MBJ6723289.1 tol-pal system protein YbgF [Geomesophilobacter sediminis]